MKRVFLFAIVGSCLLVSACNTVEGLGRDVKSAGKTVEEAAK
ncbi:MAG: entericidin A/B family lipoprotein [Chakrabartia sp.]